jgi:hypothetical protein
MGYNRRCIELDMRGLLQRAASSHLRMYTVLTHDLQQMQEEKAEGSSIEFRVNVVFVQFMLTNLGYLKRLYYFTVLTARGDHFKAASYFHTPYTCFL